MKHILDNLKKYAISYEYKSNSSIFIKKIDVPTVMWLRFIFTCGGTIPLKILENKLIFGKKKDVFNIYIN